MRKENEKSTPAENKKADFRNHVNQSTEEKDHSSFGVVGIVVVIAIIILGLLFFSGFFA